MPSQVVVGKMMSGADSTNELNRDEAWTLKCLLSSEQKSVIMLCPSGISNTTIGIESHIFFVARSRDGPRAKKRLHNSHAHTTSANKQNRTCEVVANHAQRAFGGGTGSRFGAARGQKRDMES